MAPRPLPQSWSSPSPSPTIAHDNGTLRWHPAMAPRPLHPAMAPWCHVQFAKVVRRPHPLLDVRTPIAIAIWGKSRDQMQVKKYWMNYIKWYFGFEGVGPSLGYRDVPTLLRLWGMEYDDGHFISVPFPVPCAPASCSPLEVPVKHKHAKRHASKTWTGAGLSTHNSICLMKDKLLTFWFYREMQINLGQNMVHFWVTCFHMLSLQPQQQLSSGSWTFANDFCSLSCLEVVSVTQVPRWGKLFWKSGEVKAGLVSRCTRQLLEKKIDGRYNQRGSPV